MSAPVDVLAVLDCAIDECESAAKWNRDNGRDCPAGIYTRGASEAREARAAVAELIEAASHFAQPGQVSPERVRLQTALANCGGAK